MNLNTSLSGRLRNTTLPRNKVLFPLFEAVVNSIHAIDDRLLQDENYNLSDAYVRIKFIRSGQSSIMDNSQGELIGFEIIDNGIGFTRNNYNSFQTLDSDYKISKGCRGIGRLLWLKVFSDIQISSKYFEDEKMNNRHFKFNINQGIFDESLTQVERTETITSIKLNNIKSPYNKNMPKSKDIIANKLIEHCLWYFIREGGAPKIQLEDDEIIYMDSIFEDYMINASDQEKITIKSQDFELIHVKLKTTEKNKHRIIYSAANRVVQEENCKIPGLFGVLTDGENDFCYMCFVSSTYLTERVTPERLNFNINESSVDDMFLNDEISFKEIRENILSCVNQYLSQYLDKNKIIGRKRLTDFVDQKSPRYKSILNRLNEEQCIVDPAISDKDLELKLHSYLVEFEKELLNEGHDILTPKSIENQEEYSQRVQKYLEKASDIKKSDLASYITHRKVILDLFEKAIEVQDDGKYSKESVIHQLIMPMQSNSDELLSDDSNLWLIDERLAFHNFLASDKTLKSMPISDSEETKEPDILGLNVYDNPILFNNGQRVPLASITIVEIKRPMRKDAREGEEKNPIEQALGYLKRIRDGKIQTSQGRPIPNAQDVPGFCFILCDLTPSMKERCELMQLKITSDKLGYFGYNDNYKTYVEVVSFDRLLNMAKERNKAFFDKLGLPTN